MMRYILVVLIFFVSMSCDNDKVNKPDNLISESKMVDIIVDFALLNSGSGIDKTILERAGINPENHIYKKYSIDSIQFTESNNYYAHNIDVYKDIYAKVKTKLNSKKDEYKKLNEIETKEKKRKDSIKMAEKRRKKPAIIKSESSKLPTQTKPLLKISDSLQQ